MAVISVTTANWNDPAFWNGLTIANGDTIDFSALGSEYSTYFQNATNLIRISDGNQTFRIGGESNPGEHATLGSGEVHFFDTYIASDGGSDVTMDDEDSSFVGGDGDDYVNTRSGNDTVDTGGGNDTVFGSAGNDNIVAGTGDDNITGFHGKDTIDAGDGNDSIDAGTGNDFVDAGSGDDTIIGGIGNDSIIGGDGNDIFIYSAGDGLDTIQDFNTGNTGALNDGDTTNNDFLDLSDFYDDLAEVRADFDDDGVLNQSNSTNDGGTVDYSNNALFSSGHGIELQGVSSSSELTQDNLGVVCFTADTFIATPTGDVPIQALRVGDVVQTRDNGPQRLVLITSRHLTCAELEAHPNLKPVVLAPKLIGARRPLRVSPQHGMLMQLEGDEKLVRAIHLARMRGGQARIASGCRQITYYHLLFEDHQVVFANGAPSESFYPGPLAIKALEPAAQVELLTLFPALRYEDPEIAFGASARDFARWKEMPDSLRAFGVT